jgi:hypothetical protein
MGIHANRDPDPGYTLETKMCQNQQIILHSNEKKVTTNIFLPIILIFILLMPNFQSFGCIFSFILAL